jgi:F-type H+-transporting ATPase subunit delta
MAELTTAARPYARAAFSYALDNNKIEDWSRMLEAVSLICEDDRVMQRLASPALDAATRAALLIDLAEKWLDDAMRNFLLILAENYRLPLLPDISTMFAAFVARRNKMLSVELSLASETDKALIEELRKRLSARLGEEAQVSMHIDPSLMAGAVIRAGDMVIDGSLRGRLRQLAESL